MINFQCIHYLATSIHCGIGGAATGTLVLGAGGAAAGAVVAGGVTASAVAGVFTFGIGTIVGLGITAGAAAAVGLGSVAAGAGTGVATHYIAKDCKKSVVEGLSEGKYLISVLEFLQLHSSAPLYGFIMY